MSLLDLVRRREPLDVSVEICEDCEDLVIPIKEGELLFCPKCNRQLNTADLEVSASQEELPTVLQLSSEEEENALNMLDRCIQIVKNADSLSEAINLLETYQAVITDSKVRKLKNILSNREVAT